MFGRSGGHSVTPLTERSRVGANIGSGINQLGQGIAQGITASKQAKAERKMNSTIVRELANFGKTSGAIDEGTAERYLQIAESGSNSEIKGLLSAYLSQSAMRAQLQAQSERTERLNLAKKSDARAQEQHQAQMEALPVEEARQEATTRMINAQADQYELATASQLAELEATAAGLMMPREDRKSVHEAFKAIRSEPAVKTFDAATGLLESLRENAKSADRSGAMDIGLIFSFMKVLDPGSTVREGEFANAQNSGSIPTSIYNAYNKALSGEMLTSDQVGQFLKAAETSVSGYATTANKVRKQHLDQLEKLKINSSLIAIPEFKVESSETPSFDDVTAAESANLPPGTEVIINGRRAVIE